MPIPTKYLLSRGQGNKRHGNRVMEDMRQSNKRHGNRVMEDMRQSIQDMVIG